MPGNNLVHIFRQGSESRDILIQPQQSGTAGDDLSNPKNSPGTTKNPSRWLDQMYTLIQLQFLHAGPQLFDLD